MFLFVEKHVFWFFLNDPRPWKKIKTNWIYNFITCFILHFSKNKHKNIETLSKLINSKNWCTVFFKTISKKQVHLFVFNCYHVPQLGVYMHHCVDVLISYFISYIKETHYHEWDWIENKKLKQSIWNCFPVKK